MTEQERDEEAAAVTVLAMVLEPLDAGARSRVLEWAKARFITEPVYLNGAKALGEATARLDQAAKRAKDAGLTDEQIRREADLS